MSVRSAGGTWLRWRRADVAVDQTGALGHPDPVLIDGIAAFVVFGLMAVLGIARELHAFSYSLIPIASTGRVRSARRVGTDRATRASSAETPRIAANQPAGAYGRKPPVSA